MMTVAEAIRIRQSARMIGLPEDMEADALVLKFAADMLRMTESMGKISFPIPGHLRITLDPEDESDALFITVETAHRMYRALGTALAGRS